MSHNVSSTNSDFNSLPTSGGQLAWIGWVQYARVQFSSEVVMSNTNSCWQLVGSLCIIHALGMNFRFIHSVRKRLQAKPQKILNPLHPGEPLFGGKAPTPPHGKAGAATQHRKRLSLYFVYLVIMFLRIIPDLKGENIEKNICYRLKVHFCYRFISGLNWKRMVWCDFCIINDGLISPIKVAYGKIVSVKCVGFFFFFNVIEIAQKDISEQFLSCFFPTLSE